MTDYKFQSFEEGKRVLEELGFSVELFGRTIGYQKDFDFYAVLPHPLPEDYPCLILPHSGPTNIRKDVAVLADNGKFAFCSHFADDPVVSSYQNRIRKALGLDAGSTSDTAPPELSSD